MKTLYHQLTVLIFIEFLLPSLGGAGSLTLKSFSDGAGCLHAQQQELFDYTWYFEHGEFDGVAFTSPHTSLQGEILFNVDYLEVIHQYCEEGGGGNMVDFDNSGFSLDFFDVVLLGICSQPDDIEFLGNHYSIYGAGSGTPNNPFTYTLQAIDDYHQLTIENNKGDWAVYNSKLLSTNTFKQNNFTIYPNPVDKTLQINNTYNQAFRTHIYNLNGKLLQQNRFDGSSSQIDVKSLKQGIYFLVLEDEHGQKTTRKFIKK